MSQPLFAPRGSDHDIEEGPAFAPKFDAEGLLGAIVADAATGEVLMLAWMNAEALARTIETGFATFWSRSRRAIWVKGETSGNRQKVVAMRTDCDQDAVLLEVEVEGRGASCHTGRVSCFYREIPVGAPPGPGLTLRTVAAPVFDPGKVYGGKG
jgi:phosphoribosyl-AMP cyclohydrolase